MIKTVPDIACEKCKGRGYLFGPHPWMVLMTWPCVKCGESGIRRTEQCNEDAEVWGVIAAVPCVSSRFRGQRKTRDGRVEYFDAVHDKL